MLGLPVIALMLVAPGEMKCSATVVSMPGYGTREAVFMIDGIISKPPGELGMDLQADIDWHELTCWDHQTDSFERYGMIVIIGLLFFVPPFQRLLWGGFRSTIQFLETITGTSW